MTRLPRISTPLFGEPVQEFVDDPVGTVQAALRSDAGLNPRLGRVLEALEACRVRTSLYFCDSIDSVYLFETGQLREVARGDPVLVGHPNQIARLLDVYREAVEQLDSGSDADGN